MQFGWVKAHVGIEGNEHADRMAKAGCRESLLPQITEGGVRARWKDIRGRGWAATGPGMGWVVQWSRRAVLRYTQLQVGRGDVGEWWQVIGAQGNLCRLCGVEEETGVHLAFGYEESYGLWPWLWTSLEELDDRKKWRYNISNKNLAPHRTQCALGALDTPGVATPTLYVTCAPMSST